MPRSAPTWRPRTPTPRPRSATRRRCRQTLFAEMKARIKEDDSSVPAPDGALRVLRELRHRRPVSAAVPAPARRRPRGDPARRQRGGRGQALLAARRRRAQPRPPAAGLRRRRQGLGALHHPHPRPGDRPGPARRHPRHAQRRSSGRATAATLFYVRLDDNQRPLFVYRHRVGTPGRARTCWSTRRRTSASTSASARRSRASSSSSTRTTTRPPRST